MKEISTEELLLLSWKDYRQYWKILSTSALCIAAIYVAIFFTLLLVIVGHYGYIALVLLLLAFASIVQLGYIKLLLNITGNKTVSFRQLFGKHNLSVRYIVGTASYVILTVIGLLFLILPGAIYAVRYSLWWLFLVNKDLDLVESFQESKRITQGSKKDLFFLYIILLGGNIVGFALFGVGLLVSVPVSLLVIAHAYRKLQLIRTNESLKEKKSLWHMNY